MPLRHTGAGEGVQHARVPLDERLAQRHHGAGFALGDPQRRSDLEPHRAFDHIGEDRTAAGGVRQRLAAKDIDADQPLRRLHRHHVADLDQMVESVGRVERGLATCLIQDVARLLICRDYSFTPSVESTASPVNGWGRGEGHARSLEHTSDTDGE